MMIIFPYCSFKCDRENNNKICQNRYIHTEPNIEINITKLVDRYLTNNISRAIVCGGLEPMDSFDDLYLFIKELRRYSDDDIVIYTGYNRDEIVDKIHVLSREKNIIMKFGRYIPNQKTHYDPILGVNLASDNQYAERIS